MALKHTESGEIVDLRPFWSQLAAMQTHAIMCSSRLKTERPVVRAGIELPTHSVTGRITLQSIQGHAKPSLAEKTRDMQSDDQVYPDGDKPLSMTGVQLASLLLTCHVKYLHTGKNLLLDMPDATPKSACSCIEAGSVCFVILRQYMQIGIAGLPHQFMCIPRLKNSVSGAFLGLLDIMATLIGPSITNCETD
ncbi:hypothetical protein [Roseinatronobacter sp. S2]|uniref:hypothetical protein n=1 Tax=Roseinatronobacter sp. S2 TaxID=3035471 RepID=UPI00240F59E8|nr:hypothetical protein [Roseinatronobacter sp. S2]WFE77233.1 hypothetical protein P8S53_20480 [Roseinatronobacter sp. S2]